MEATVDFGGSMLCFLIELIQVRLTWIQLSKYANKRQVISEIHEWKNMLNQIYSAIDDAEERQIEEESVKTWVDEVREVVYEVKNVVYQLPWARRSKLQEFLSTIFAVKVSLFEDQTVLMIKRITAELAEMTKQKDALGLRERSRRRVKRQNLPTATSSSSSRMEKAEREMIELLNEGEEKRVKEITEIEERRNSIPIILINEKADLTRLLHRHPQLRWYNSNACVDVGEDFDVLSMTKEVLVQLSDGGGSGSENLVSVQDKLKRELVEKKLLLVLKLDVLRTSMSYDSWNIFLVPFKSGGVQEQSVTIIVAIRINDLTRSGHYGDFYNRIMGDTVRCYFLPKSEEWLSLVAEHAREATPDDGEEIVEKCFPRRPLEEAKESLINLIKTAEERRDRARGEVPQIPIIRVTGLPGIGKTTLADIIFNHTELDYSLKSWVYVGKEFDVFSMTKRILLQLSDDGDGNQNLELEMIQDQLKHKLLRHKFLLVLDDIRSWNSEDWSRFLAPFKSDSNALRRQSSTIITTETRSILLPKITSRHDRDLVMTLQRYLCPLKEPTDENCLSLFTEHALGAVTFDNHLHQKLKQIGEKMVRKCSTKNYLAIKALGGLLRGIEDRWIWNEVLHNRTWNPSDNEEGIHPALKLSYHYLPSHLKMCLISCAFLFKGLEFDRDSLVSSWIQNGILPSNEDEMKALGHQYFDDLLTGYFFQQSSENPSRYVMHQQVDDLANSVVKETKFQLPNQVESTVSSVPYLPPKVYLQILDYEVASLSTSIVLQVMSAVFDQLDYNLLAILISILGLILWICDAASKAKFEKVTVKCWRGWIPWFYSTYPDQKLFGDGEMYFGLAAAIWELFYTCSGLEISIVSIVMNMIMFFYFTYFLSCKIHDNWHSARTQSSQPPSQRGRP